MGWAKGGADDGGQAFPWPSAETSMGCPGMSLRDWFAGQALAGLLANPSEPLMRCGGEEAKRLGETFTHQTYSRWAFEAADAMLARRAKEPPS